jgi:histidyl-tRNA synthetase
MGSSKPEGDAEIILLTNSLMKEAGLKNYSFKIGHVGVLRGIFNQEKLSDKTQNAMMQLMDKKQYDDALTLIQESGASQKCLNVIKELVKLKGSRVFDIVSNMRRCVEDYEEASNAVNNLGEILKLVSESGNKLETTVDAGFARGLEYYTGIIFEVYVPELDTALGGGGRYDKLIQLFGGEPTPAVGVAHGLDRIMLALQEQKYQEKANGEKTVIVIPIQEELKGQALKIAKMLRDEDLRVEVEVMGRKMSKALEDANKKRTGFAVIVGERELKEEAVTLRDLEKREQSVVKIDKLVDVMKKQTSQS